jgi:hypothetical protein
MTVMTSLEDRSDVVSCGENGSWRFYEEEVIYNRFYFSYRWWGCGVASSFPSVCIPLAIFQLPKAIGLDSLFLISRYYLYIALCAWLVMFAGFVHNALLVLRLLHAAPR